MRLSIGMIALALAASANAAPAARRDAVQDVGNGFKKAGDYLGVTTLHNAADKYAHGSIKQYENESGLTEAATGLGVEPFGQPVTKRDAVQDVGNGFKKASDVLGITTTHNVADKMADGAIKNFENDSGATEAATGLGIEPFGQPVTKRDEVVQNAGHRFKQASDQLGITAAHNAADKLADGAIKNFEDDSGATEAATGFGLEPYGEAVTKRQEDAAASLADFDSYADQFDHASDLLKASYQKFQDAAKAHFQGSDDVFRQETADFNRVASQVQAIVNEMQGAMQAVVAASTTD